MFLFSQAGLNIASIKNDLAILEGSRQTPRVRVV
jgi:hypothetical protein